MSAETIFELTVFYCVMGFACQLAINMLFKKEGVKLNFFKRAIMFLLWPIGFPVIVFLVATIDDIIDEAFGGSND